LALQEVSKRVAGSHNTDEVLDLIVNEAARLLDTTAATIRLLEGTLLVPSAATESAAGFLVRGAEVRPTINVEENPGIMARVVATKSHIYPKICRKMNS